MSHLSGASQPTRLTPDHPNVPPTPFSHLPPPPPKASPRSRPLSRMSYFPSGKGLERVRPGVGRRECAAGSPRRHYPSPELGLGFPLRARDGPPGGERWIGPPPATFRAPGPSSRRQCPGLAPSPRHVPAGGPPAPPRSAATHRAGGRGSRDRRGACELCAGDGRGQGPGRRSPTQPRPPPPEKFAARRRAGGGGEGREGEGS